MEKEAKKFHGAKGPLLVLITVIILFTLIILFKTIVG